MSSALRISIAMCTFNGMRHLPAQLQSILEQSRRPDEMVVCDDGSTDGTVDALEAFAASAPFPVRVERNPVNLGSSKNFEQALGRCTGDVIALADQDDIWLSHKLTVIESAFRDEPRLGLAFSDAFVIDESSTRTGERLWPNLPFTFRQQLDFNRGGGARQLLRYNVVTGAACAVRASLRRWILPIDPLWVHDAWIALLATALAPARAIADPLLLYRRHSAQQIGVRPWTLSHQWRAARRMDEAYFENRLQCFRRIADRLAAIECDLVDPTLREAVRRKVVHSEVQVAMRRRSRLARPFLALGELVHGNYHRFGRGIKSFAVDAFL